MWTKEVSMYELRIVVQEIREDGWGVRKRGVRTMKD